MKKIRRLVIWILIVVLSLSLLSGCSGNAPEETKASEREVSTEESATVVSTEVSVPVELVVGIPDAVQSLDPMGNKNTTYGGNVIGQVFDTLVVNNFETTEIVPALAKKWDISDDGLIYTFYLRDDVYFHKGEFQNGRQMVADDVVYTFDRADKLFVRNRAQLDNIVSVEAVDDFTVVFTLEKPDSQTLAVITQKNFGIVPKEDVEGMGDAYGAKVALYVQGTVRRKLYNPGEE